MIHLPSEAWWCLAVPFIIMLAVIVGQGIINLL